MGRLIDLTDQRFGRWTVRVISRTGKTPPAFTAAHLECGGEVVEHYTREQLDSVPSFRPERL
jgi:hypothetical protein